MHLVRLLPIFIATLVLFSPWPALSGTVTCGHLFASNNTLAADLGKLSNVRTARLDDLDSILKIQDSRSRSVVGPNEHRGFLSEPYTASELKNLIENPDVQFYVFESEGSVLGFSLGYRLKPDEENPPIHEFEIESEAIRNILLNEPVYYGREIAVATDAAAIVAFNLFRAHIQYADQNGFVWGVNMVSLDPPNRRSMRLHSHFGLKEVGRGTDVRNGQVFGLYFRPVRLENWPALEGAP